MENKNVMWKIMKALPAGLRAPMVRGQYELTTPLGPEWVFKKAHTYDEIEQSFKIAYQGYHKAGMVSDQANEMQVSKFHALPTTTILVAKHKEKVVATATVILDSSMGLPIESNWTLAHLRHDSIRLAEVSWLTVQVDGPERRQVLLTFCKYIFEYCLRVLGVETLVAAVPEDGRDFFELVLLFENIESAKPKAYDLYHGKKALGQCLRINDVAQDVFKQVYGGKPSNKDLYRFFCETEIKNFQFPKVSAKNSVDYTFTPDLLEYFFRKQSDILNDLNEKDRNALSNLYFYSPFKSVIGLSQTSAYRDRRQPRFMILCRSRFCIRASGRMMTSTVLEVSRNGLKLRMIDPHQSYVGEEVSVSVELSPQNNVTLRGKVVWVLSGIQQLGIELESSVPEKWAEFVDVLEEELKLRTQKASERKQA